MTRDPAWRSDLKKLAYNPGGLLEALYMPKYISETDDRIAAILAATGVEDHLIAFIRTSMVSLNKTEDNELFGQAGPLANHGIRIKLAYALGFIGKKTLNNLEIVRLIRNAFAHSRKAISFSTPEIHAACKKLTITDQTESQESSMLFGLPLDDPRKRFLATARLLSDGLMRATNPQLFDDGRHAPLD